MYLDIEKYVEINEDHQTRTNRSYSEPAVTRQSATITWVSQRPNAVTRVESYMQEKRLHIYSD